MSPEKKHKLLFGLSFFLLVPLLIEWNFLSISGPEMITDKKYHITTRSRRKTVSYKLYTNANREFGVNQLLFINVAIGDTIQVRHTKITNRLQSIIAPIDDRPTKFRLGFLNYSIGFFVIPVIMLGSLFAIIFYNKINPPGRSGLAWLMLILSISQVILYLLL